MLRIYNSLSRKIEEFRPIDPPSVKMYACGPTVYDYQHVGHMRRYVGDDVLINVLKENGYEVKHAMNITDVGHLTSDADAGEDKMEKGAKKMGLTVWDVAKKFENQFLSSIDNLNIKRPDILMHATKYVPQQIKLIQELEKKGFTYETKEALYFDVSKFKHYGRLSGQKLEEKIKGAREEVYVDPEKKNQSDFALWLKRVGRFKDHTMHWDSPWGDGFPGWHIECSAMSMSSLGETLDIHTGGIDHIPVHHENEIAQSEASTGKKFVNYWIHHAFLLVEGQKMSKSLGNFYTVDDVISKGFDPLALRYLYLQTHYRQEMNFTWEALEGSQKALDKLRKEVQEWGEPKIGCAEYEQKFLETVNDDLNMPKALAVVWELVKSDYPGSAKKETILKFDRVLGLNLVQSSKVKVKSQIVPEEVQNLIKEREELRKKKEFEKADEIREKIKELGFEIEDKNEETKVLKIN